MSKPDVAAERKSQIVKATVECMTQFGYHNFSMQDVARGAGVSKGIIHYYFLNKDELMLSVLDRVAANIESQLSQQMSEVEGPMARLEVFLAGCFDIVLNQKEYYQVNMDFWTQINQKKEVKDIISKHYDKFRTTAAQLIQDGIDAGLFLNVSPTDYASFMVAVVDGLSLQNLFSGNEAVYKDQVKLASKQIREGLVKRSDSDHAD